MRTSVWGAILLILLISDGAAAEQEFKPALKLDIGSLSIPDTPAFQVLDVAPSSVSRPGSARELATTLFSSSTDDSSFPRNLALEFSPYWWSYHPELTWEKYNKNDNIGDNLMQTFTVSFATSETKFKDNDVDVDGTGLGLGFRTSFLKGRPPKKAEEAKNQIVEIFRKNVDTIIPDDPSSLPTDDKGNRIIDLNQISDTMLLKKIQTAQDAFRKANLNRVGLRIELASAASFNFLDDKADEGEFKNAGAWLNAAYRRDEESWLSSLDLLGVFRYLWNDSDDGSFSTFDLGGRIIWISQNEDIPFSASVEYTYRFVSDGDKKDSDKLAFISEYRVSKTWSLFASMGRTFDPNFEGDEDFTALFGINFGYGKGPVVTEPVPFP